MPSAGAIAIRPSHGSVAIGWFVILLWAGFAAISVWLAYRFGYGRAEELADRRLYGAVGVVVDLAKSVLPLCAVFASAHYQYGLAFVLWSVFALFTFFSLVAALGFAAEHLAARERAGGDQASQATDIRRIEARLVELGATRAPGVVEREIETAFAQPASNGRGVGAQSKRCTVDLLIIREACGAIARLQLQLEKSREAVALRAELVEARRERQRMIDARGPGDVQVEILSMLSRLPQDWVRTGLAVLLAVVIELGSGLLLYVGGTQVMGPGWHARLVRSEKGDPPARDAVVAQPTDGAEVNKASGVEEIASQMREGPASASVMEYMLARVDYGPGDVRGQQVYEDYLAWCGELGFTPRDRGMFGEGFLMLAVQVGIPRTIGAEDVTYRNVKLGSVAAAAG